MLEALCTAGRARALRLRWRRWERLTTQAREAEVMEEHDEELVRPHLKRGTYKPNT